MKRALSLILSLIMALSPVCTAFADFSLPAALTAIESEAFRDMPISGNVTLPDGVKSIGDRAFAGTGVYSMDMPSGLETIGDGILDGADAIYVDIPGADTQLTGTSLGAKYMIGASGSSAQTWANANSVSFLDSANVVRQDGFVYSYVADVEGDQDGLPSGYYLMFPEHLGHSGSVTVPETVGGEPVVFIGPYAFTRLSGVTDINVPDSAEMPAAQMEWPDAQINTYATASLDVWVVSNAFSMPLGAFAIPRWGVNAPEGEEQNTVCSISCDNSAVLDLYVNETNDWFSAKSYAQGEATITITAQNGELTDTETITITVTEEAPVPDPSTATEATGSFTQLAVVPGDEFALIIEEVLPQSDTWYNQHWMSTNTDVVVAENGPFEVVGVGEADVYSFMTLANGDVYYAKAHIISTETGVPDGAAQIPLSHDWLKANPGEFLGLWTDEELPEGSFDWWITSSDENVAVWHEGGEVKFVGLGSVVLTMVFAFESGEYLYGYSHIDVVEPTLNIFFTEEPLRLPVGTTVYIPWEIEISSDLGYGYEELFELEHAVDDATVVELNDDENGVPYKLTTLKAGETTYTIEGEVRGAYDSATLQIEVYDPEIALNTYNVQAYTGFKYQLSVESELPEGAVVTFASSDESLATVDEKGVVTLLDPTEEWNAEIFNVDVTCTASYEENGEEVVLSQACRYEVVEWNFEFRDVDCLEEAARDDIFVWPMIRTQRWGGHQTCFTLESVSHNTDVLTFGGASNTLDQVPQAFVQAIGTADVTFKATFCPPDATPADGTVTYIEKTIPVTIHEPWLEAHIYSDPFELDGVGDYRHIGFDWYGEVEPTRMVFSSSDESVVTVNADGLVRAVGEGEATVTYKVEWKYGVVREASVDVRVCSGKVTLNATEITLAKGESFTLVPYMDVPEGAHIDTYFYSSNEDVAYAYRNGLVTGLSAGTAVVTFGGSIDDRDAHATCIVHVTDDEAAIELAEDYKLLRVGEVYQLNPSLTTPVEGAVFTYESSDEGSLSVDENGELVLLGHTDHVTHYPYVIIRAVVGEDVIATAYFTVHSYKPPVMISGIHFDDYLSVGDEREVYVDVIEDADSQGYTIEYVSGDTGVFTVEDGVITAVAQGTADLTVTLRSLDGSEVYDQQTVAVFVETDFPVPTGIAFNRPQYFVSTDAGDQAWEDIHVSLLPVEDELMRYWGVELASSDTNVVEVGDWDIHGLSEGKATLTATVRIDDETEIQASADVFVADFRVAAFDQDGNEYAGPYQPGDVVTMKIVGFPEELGYEWIRWSFDDENLTLLSDERDTTELRVRVNQPGEYRFNADIYVNDNWWHNYDGFFYCEGDWNDWRFSTTDMFAAVGDEFWIGPEFERWSVTSEIGDTSIVTKPDENDPCWFRAVGAGETTITFYVQRWEGDEEFESVTVNVTVEEPEWGIYDFDNAPSVMQVGRGYWCGVNYWYNGYNFEQHETLTMSETSAAHFSEDDRFTVIADQPGTFTLTASVTIGGRTETVSKDILVVEPDVYLTQDEVYLCPKDTYQPELIAANGAVISSVFWKSSDESKAAVDAESGFVTVYGAEGRAVITADVTLEGGAVVSVSFIVEIIHHDIASMEVNNPYVNICVDQIMDVWFVEDLPDCDGWQDWTWESSDESVLTFEGDGTFKAVGLGSANAMLTVTYEDGRRFYGVSRVNVVEPEFEIFFNDDSIRIPVGATHYPSWDFSTSGDWYEGGFDFSLTNADENVEAVQLHTDDEIGLCWLTAHEAGEATLTISGSYFGVEASASIDVIVYEPQKEVAFDRNRLNTYTGFTSDVSLIGDLEGVASIEFGNFNEDVLSIEPKADGEAGQYVITVFDREGEEWYDETIFAWVTYEDGTVCETDCIVRICPWIFELHTEEFNIPVYFSDRLYPAMRRMYWAQDRSNIHYSMTVQNPANEDGTVDETVYLTLEYTEFTEGTEPPVATAHAVGTTQLVITAEFVPADGTPIDASRTKIERTVPVYINAPYIQAHVGNDRYEFGSVGDSKHLNYWCDCECELERQYFTSSDTSVVTIDASGEMQAVGAGCATVTYTAEAYGVKSEASAEVYVCGVGMTLNPSSAEIAVGETLCIIPEINLPSGAQMEIRGIYSSNDEIAFADHTGTVYGVAAGYAVITVEARVWNDDENDGYSYEERAQCAVTVAEPQALITLNETFKVMSLEDSFTLVPSFPEGATVTDLTFTSNDEDHILVDNSGVVTALQGTGGYSHYPSVCVSATVNGVSAKAYCTVRIDEMSVAFGGYQPMAEMSVGESCGRIGFDVVTTDPDIAYVIRYATDNEAIVTVNAESGEMTAVSAGVAKITVRLLSEDGSVLYDQIMVPVYVDAAIPEPTGIAFREDAYYLFAEGYGDAWCGLNASLTTDTEFVNEMWRFYDEGRIAYEVTSGTDVVEIVDGRELHALGMGTAEVTATFTYTDAQGNEKSVQTSVPVYVLQPELVADKEPYKRDEIATLTLTGIPDGAVFDECDWEFYNGTNGMTRVYQDDRTLKVRLNQPNGNEHNPDPYYVNIRVHVGGRYFECGCAVNVTGEWREYVLFEQDVTMAPGDVIWADTYFGWDHVISASVSKDGVVVLGNPDEGGDLREITVCDDAQAGDEVEVTLVFALDAEETQTAECSLVIHIVEPVWEIHGWNVASVMQVGRNYWGGVDYSYTGWRGIEEYVTLSVDDPSIAKVSDENHLEIVPLAEGTFTLTIEINDIDIEGVSEKPYTMSRTIRVIDPEIRMAESDLYIRPGETVQAYLDVDEGIEIGSVTWSSANPGLFPVDGEGNVTALGANGRGLIYADVTYRYEGEEAFERTARLVSSVEISHHDLEWRGLNWGTIHVNPGETFEMWIDGGYSGDGITDFWYLSSDESIVRHTGDGWFEATENTGSAQVMIAIRYDGGHVIFGEATVVVQEPGLEVFFNEESISMLVGQTYWADWGSYSSSDLFDRNYTFTVADESILAVETSYDGTDFWLVGLAPGETTLTITAAHGDMSSSASIPVTVCVQDVLLETYEMYAYTGFTYQVVVDETLSDGAVVSYQSSDDSIASVDENGLVTVHAREYDGETFDVEITCTVTEGENSRTGVYTMYVLPWLFGFNEEVTELGIAAGTSDYVWNRLRTAFWSNHREYYTLKSESSDPALLEFGEETHTLDVVPDATAHRVGQVDATFTATFNPPDATPMEGTVTTVTRTIPVYIHWPYNIVANIHQDDHYFECVGDYTHIGFDYYAEGEVISQMLTSSNPDVVTVTADGRLIATGVGEADIVYTVTGLYGMETGDSMHVTVNGRGISLNETEITLAKGETFQLEAMINNISDSAYIEMSYESTSVEVASVDGDGLITANAAGMAVITCDAWVDEGGWGTQERVQCVVRVTDGEALISLNATELYLNQNQTFTLVASLSEAAQQLVGDETVQFAFYTSDEGNVPIVADEENNGVAYVTMAGTTFDCGHYPFVWVSAQIGDQEARAYCTVRFKTPDVYFRGVDEFITLSSADEEGCHIGYDIVSAVPGIAYAVKFMSEDTSIAQVDENTGCVTGVGAGLTHVIAQIVSEDGETIYDERSVEVFVDTDLPALAEIRFVRDHFLINTENGIQSGTDVWAFELIPLDTENYTAEDMWKYHSSRVWFSSEDESIVGVPHGVHIFGASEGETCIAAHVTCSVDGEEVVLTSSNTAKVTVADVKLVADQESYTAGSVATVRIDNFPEDIPYEFIKWHVWTDGGSLDMWMYDCTQIQIPLNVPDYIRVNAEVRIGDEWHHGMDAEFACNGDRWIAWPEHSVIELRPGAQYTMNILTNDDVIASIEDVTWTSHDTSLATADQDDGTVVVCGEAGSVLISAELTMLDHDNNTVTNTISYVVDIISDDEIFFEYHGHQDWAELAAQSWSLMNTADVGVDVFTNAMKDEINVEWTLIDNAADFIAIDETWMDEDPYGTWRRPNARIRGIQSGDASVTCTVSMDGVFSETYWFHLHVQDQYVSITPVHDVVNINTSDWFLAEWNEQGLDQCRHITRDVLTSSDEFIARTDVHGNVTGAHVGQATITCSLYVDDILVCEGSFVVNVGGISMARNKESVTLAVGGTTPLNLYYETTYEDVELYGYNCASTDESVATVVRNDDGTCTLTGVGAGSAVIHLSADTNYGTVSCELVVTVTDDNASALTIAVQHVEENAFVGAAPTKFFSGMDYQFVAMNGDTPVDAVWSVSVFSDEDVTIDTSTGVLSVGEMNWIRYCVVTCTAEIDGRQVSASYPMQMHPARIRITKHQMTEGLGAWRRLRVGESDNIYETGACIESEVGVHMNWTSSDENVVFVDQSGCVYAVGEGNADVTLTVWTDDGEVVASTMRYVVYEVCIVPEIDGRYVEEITLEVGQAVYANWYVFRNDDGGPVKSIAIYSDNDDVVVTDGDGRIEAVGPGTAIVTRRLFTDDGMLCESFITVHVSGVTVTCDVDALELSVGNSASISANIVSSYDDLVINGWNIFSSDENVAIVDGEGNVLAVGAGSAIIFCQLDSNHGFPYVEVKVTVVDDTAPQLSISAAHTAENAAVLGNGETPTKFFNGMDYQFSYAFDGDVDSVTWNVEYDRGVTVTIDENGLLSVEDVPAPACCTVSCEVTSGENTYRASYPISVCQRTIFITFWEMSDFPCTWSYLNAPSEGCEPETQWINEIVHLTDESVAVMHEWKSSDESVVTVDQYANVTAVGPGEADVTLNVYTSDGEVEIAYKHFCVGVTKTVTNLVLSEERLVRHIDWGNFGAPVETEPAYSIWDFEHSGYDESVIALNEDGSFLAVGAGRTTVTTTQRDTGLSVEWDVVIVDNSVQMKEETGRTTLSPGEKVQLVFEGEGVSLTQEDIEWIRFENYYGEHCFVVDENGQLMVTGTDDGMQINVFAEVGVQQGYSIRYEYSFTVDAAEYFYLRLSDSWNLNPVIYPGYARYVQIESNAEYDASSVLCVSDNEAVATVDGSGVLHTHAAGTAKLTTTATTTDGRTLSDEMVITVVAPENPRISCEIDYNILQTGETYNVWIGCDDPYSVVPEYSFVSGDESILRFNGQQDEYGSQTVTAVGEGLTTLTAVANYGTYEVRDTVTICVGQEIAE